MYIVVIMDTSFYITYLHYIDKKPITNNGEPIVIGKQTTIKLKLVPQKEDNGAEYQ